MKYSFLLFALSILSLNCSINDKNNSEKVPPSNNSLYLEFIEKFDTKEKSNYKLNKELEDWTKNGIHINLSDYSPLFRDVNFCQDWLPSQNNYDSLIALGINPSHRIELFQELFNKQITLLASFPNITKQLQYDLLLVQTQTKLLLLIGDKKEKKICDFFHIKDSDKDWYISHKVSHLPEVWYKETKTDSSSNSKYVYEIKTKIKENGKFISDEVYLNKNESFFLDKEESICGFYELQSDIISTYITIKPGSSSKKISYKATFSEHKTSHCITFDNDDIVLDENNGFNFLHPQNGKLLFRIYFKNQHAYIKWNGCLDLESIPCEINFVARKEKNS